MSTACVTVQDRLPELAFGVLDGVDREELLRHLEGCSRCRAEVGELAGIADRLGHLAPEIEPPAGFQGRVLAAMGTRPVRRRGRRFVAVAAAVLVGVLAVGVGVEVWTGAAGPSSEVGAPAVRTVPMLDHQGVAVGHVVVGRDRRNLAVSIEYAIPDGTYTLTLRSGASPAQTIAALAVVGGRGAWRGAVQLPDSGPMLLSMLDHSAVTVCQAVLGPVTA